MRRRFRRRGEADAAAAGVSLASGQTRERFRAIRRARHEFDQCTKSQRPGGK